MSCHTLLLSDSTIARDSAAQLRAEILALYTLLANRVAPQRCREARRMAFAAHR
jgi:hypothetical protein